MGIIEEQRQQIEAEIKQARNRQRQAEQSVEAEKSKYLWAKANPSLALDANFFILENYLANAGIQISVDSLDLASRACKSQLAVRAPEAPEPTAEERRIAENERLKSLSVPELRAEVQADIKRKLATPEYGSHGAVFVPPFTAEEFLRMSPSQVKAVMQYPGSNQLRPGVREGIDRLLRDAQLLKESKSN